MKINEVLEREEVQDGAKGFTPTDAKDDKTILYVQAGEVYVIIDHVGAACFHRWQPCVADLVADYEVSK